MLSVMMSWILVLFATPSAQADVQPQIKSLYKKNAAHVESFYRDLHQHPELSKKEFRTSKKLADELKKLGYTVTDKVGGTGLVGVFKNGTGPTIWLRADMDGLPIKENTGKPYASKNVGVMHACGHDVHVATMIAYADILVKLKDKWKGTVVMIGQPAEEVGAGASDMIKDGLYKRFPKPDYVLGLHVTGKYDAGYITYTEGYAMAAVDSIDIELTGLGGHGSTPHLTIDPIVLASKIIVNTQTLVSRNIDTREAVVLTYGSIHGGTKHNIIPDKVHIQGTLRTYSEDVRKKMKTNLVKTVKLLAKAEGAPKPKVTFGESLPATFNHIALTKRLAPIFAKVAGPKKAMAMKGIMGAEDFSLYRQKGTYPTIMFFIGGAPKNKKNFGLNHNARFAPEYKTAIRIGAEAMVLSVFELSNGSEGKSRKLSRSLRIP